LLWSCQTKSKKEYLRRGWLAGHSTEVQDSYNRQYKINNIKLNVTVTLFCASVPVKCTCVGLMVHQINFKPSSWNILFFILCFDSFIVVCHVLMTSHAYVIC
jgi:hypothetical protein